MPTVPRCSRPIRIVQSRQNARVKELRAALSRSARTVQGLLAIEGEHLLREAVASGVPLATVFVETGREESLDRLRVPLETEVLSLPPAVFAGVVQTESPQGIAALVMPRASTLDEIVSGPRPLVLIAAGLQDPGNLGTLIRSAEAFGATGCVVLPGTVSPENQKVLRASSGSIFRLPGMTLCADHIFGVLAERRIKVVAAIAAEGQPLAELDLTQPCALVIGNEGGGIAPDILRRADIRVTIPTPGPVESLNAAIAGSILLYEAARQRSRA